MKRLEKAILNIIRTTNFDGDQNYWRYVLEDDGIHIFCWKITTTLDIVSMLGDSGVTFSLSYSLDETDSMVLSEDEPIEIAITKIPEELVVFENFP